MQFVRTGKYSGIVFSIALFVLLVAAVLSANFYMAAQFARDTELVNLAARQQTLSQQTVKALLQTDNALGSGNLIDDPLSEFKTSYRLFDETLQAFQRGGPVTTPAGERSSIAPLSDPIMMGHINEATKVWIDFKGKAQSIADFEGNIERDADFTVNDAEGKLEGAMFEAIVYSARARVSASLLEHINQVAVGLERQAANRAQRLQAVQIAGIVLALVAFAIIVFYFLRNLRRSDEALHVAEQQKDEILSTVTEGLFLLDREQRIGSQYSAAVETIFRREDLGGTEFLKLLKEIVPEKTLETARDYVGLFFGGRINEKLVDDLNPLDKVEVHFRDESGGFVTRYLGFSFKRVIVGGELSHLLVTVNDISEVVGLRRLLEQSQDQGRSQMDMLMGILHVEPSLLHDFLETADRDLDAINAALKRQCQNQADFVDRLDEIFRRTHSIKGESSALGLESVAGLAHELEEQVQKLKENTNLSGGDFLPLTMRLDDLMSHMLSVRKLIGNLAQFRASPELESENGHCEVEQDERRATRRNLPAMLGALGERLAQEQGKQVEVVCHGFDMRGMNDAMHKSIKDICVQLVRNGVSHGIEDPEERLQGQKDRMGRVALNVRREGDQIVLNYRDDGRGLLIDKIREAALARGFVSADQVHEMDDRQIMSLIFRRGFSTSSKVDGSAGRGVGMDVIRHLVQELGGKVRMSTVAGQHTSFGIVLPGVAVAGDSNEEAA